MQTIDLIDLHFGHAHAPNEGHSGISGSPSNDDTFPSPRPNRARFPTTARLGHGMVWSRASDGADVSQQHFQVEGTG